MCCTAAGGAVGVVGVGVVSEAGSADSASSETSVATVHAFRSVTSISGAEEGCCEEAEDETDRGVAVGIGVAGEDDSEGRLSSSCCSLS